MSRIAKALEALQRSRQRQADAVIRRYRHLAEEARAYERRREIEARDNAKRTSQTLFTTADQLCTSASKA